MQQISLKFEGTPQKFGKAAYCDLIYTQSKLSDHVLYKDLINFKDVWNFKSEAFALAAINQHLQDKCAYGLLQKNTIIETQIQEISFLKLKNEELANKNIERTKKILKEHQETVQNLLKEKQEEVVFVQCEKQLLQGKIEMLQAELTKNIGIVNSIEKQRDQMLRKDKEFKESCEKLSGKILDLEKTIQQLEKCHKIQIKQLNDQKLQTELHFKRLMLEHSQTYKQQIEDLERFYEKKHQIFEEQRLNESLASKQSLNRVLKSYESKLQESKLKTSQLQQLVEKLSKEVDYQRQRSSSLQGDVKKQDDILDKYETYLKESDQNIINLKSLLLECQQELEKAKISLQKNQIERDSFQNRIKICEEEAKMWRQSYYLNKSRAFNDN